VFVLVSFLEGGGAVSAENNPKGIQIQSQTQSLQGSRQSVPPLFSLTQKHASSIFPSLQHHTPALPTNSAGRKLTRSGISPAMRTKTAAKRWCVVGPHSRMLACSGMASRAAESLAVSCCFFCPCCCCPRCSALQEGFCSTQRPPAHPPRAARSSADQHHAACAHS
jgi:hypothetical protein